MKKQIRRGPKQGPAKRSTTILLSIKGGYWRRLREKAYAEGLSMGALVETWIDLHAPGRKR